VYAANFSALLPYDACLADAHSPLCVEVGGTFNSMLLANVCLLVLLASTIFCFFLGYMLWTGQTILGVLLDCKYSRPHRGWSHVVAVFGPPLTWWRWLLPWPKLHEVKPEAVTLLRQSDTPP